MPDLPEELIRANTILGEYVAIHDAIFKFSWRKTLPIPGLFKTTDFGSHFRDLDRLASKLAAISARLKAESGSLEGSHQYTAALLEDYPSAAGDLPAVLREEPGQFQQVSDGRI